MSLKNILRGTGVAIVTPFKKNREVDYAALEGLIDHLIANGVEYIVSLGSTGEAATLSKEEMADVVNCTYDKVNNRIPVVVGLAGNNTAELIKNITALPLDKSVAVLSSSPSYNKPSQAGIYQHYKLFSEACPKPVILYNVPGRTGSNMTAETTVKLAHECKNVAGIKEASGHMVQCMHILKDAPKDFLVVSGDDHIAFPLITLGMDGVISVAANCFARDFSEMIRSVLKNDLESAKKIQYQLLDGMDLLFVENNPAGLKCFLAEMGLIENVLRLPLVPVSAGVHQKIKDFISKNK
ncbi:MAG TPA: 4-hydroxy-tetrahydrodipicolinate synthase [Chitinophagaceae bacterium]|nr:4-hydroxy-tetrahydrodipicolinate synthase [Chitinophagaceae bacterium]